MMRRSTTCVPVVVMGLAGTCPGGEILLELTYRIDSPDSRLYAFGSSVAALGGDADGDGVPDFVVGAWEGGMQSGGVLVSGADGGLLAILKSWYRSYGYTVTGAGDLDGDGVPDWAMGSFYPQQPPMSADSSCWVYSGTFRGVYEYPPGEFGPEFYWHVGGYGLAGGQGRVVASDLSDDNTPVGTVYFMTGADPTVRAEIFHHDPNGNFDFGWAVSNVGDYNEGGIDDYAITQPRFNRLFLVSGAIATEGPVHVETLGPQDLLLVLTAAPPQVINRVVGNVGDLTGDGTPDLACVGAGVSIYDLDRDAEGQLVSRVHAQLTFAEAAWSVVTVGDVDGDWVPDFAVGYASAGYPIPVGAVRFFSGATLAALRRLDAQAPTAYFGMSMAAIGDLEGDGRMNVTVSAPGMGPTGRGEVFVYNAGWITRQADFDFDNDVDLADFLIFQRCFTGSNNAYGRECRICDLDNDGDVDLGDFVIFQQRFTGSL